MTKKKSSNRKIATITFQPTAEIEAVLEMVLGDKPKRSAKSDAINNALLLSLDLADRANKAAKAAHQKVLDEARAQMSNSTLRAPGHVEAEKRLEEEHSHFAHAESPSKPSGVEPSHASKKHKTQSRTSRQKT